MSIFNASNLMSILRIVLSLPLGYFIYQNEKLWIIIISFIAILTDFLDGFLARKFDQVTELGRILDPVADKLVIAVSGLVLIITQRLPLWFGIIIIARDVLILLGGLYLKKRTGNAPSANYLGKVTVNIISLAILLIIFEIQNWIDPAIWLATIAIVLSFLSYVYVLIKKLR